MRYLRYPLPQGLVLGSRDDLFNVLAPEDLQRVADLFKRARPRVLREDLADRYYLASYESIINRGLFTRRLHKDFVSCLQRLELFCLQFDLLSCDTAFLHY